MHSGAFSLVVIPTFEGTPFLERTLDYFRDLAFKGRIVLADNSSGEHRKFVAACAGKYPALKLEVLAYPEPIRVSRQDDSHSRKARFSIRIAARPR